jgi:exodeoxyribonuclease V alpha subunit
MTRKRIWLYTELNGIPHTTGLNQATPYKFTSVILPVHTQHYVMLAKNLLYTAVTRGKRLVLTIGSARAVKLSVENSRSRKRFTRFTQRLVGEA